VADRTPAQIDDGHGNRWQRCGSGCDLHVVRPGKVQCNVTSDDCPDRSTCGACGERIRLAPGQCPLCGGDPNEGIDNFREGWDD